MLEPPIAVVGGTGRIGAQVVRLLREAERPVRMLVRAGSPDRPVPRGVEVVRGDMRDSASVGALLAGTDSLFMVSSDVDGELAVATAAGAAGVRRVVKSSAIGFRDHPPAGHAAVEQAIARHVPSWAFVRPSAFMQTLHEYLPQLIDAGGVFRLPAGDGATAWVDTRDVAAVCTAAVLSPDATSRILTATGPEALDMHQVAEVYSAALRRDIRYQDTPPAEALPAMLARVGPMAHFLVEHYTAVARGGFEVVSPDVEEVVGHPPQSLAAFLSEQTDPLRPGDQTPSLAAEPD